MNFQHPKIENVDDVLRGTLVDTVQSAANIVSALAAWTVTLNAGPDDVGRNKFSYSYGMESTVELNFADLKQKFQSRGWIVSGREPILVATKNGVTVSIQTMTEHRVSVDGEIVVAAKPGFLHRR